MVDRSVVVKLTASVGDYVNGMSKAAKATKDLESTASKGTQNASKGYENLGNAVKVGTGALVLGLGFAVKSSADFDQAMSHVKANLDDTSSFDKLRESVMNAGTAYGFSATESAEGAEDLAKAGLKTNEIMSALPDVLALAAAGGVSTGEAAETAANAMSMFNLKASDTGKIADVLANGANMSTASIGSLAQGLSQGGNVAASFGLTLQDTVTTLAMFDQAGLKGSDAGTSLKTMLSSLASPSKQAQKTMDALGIATFDASGKFVGMSALQDQLKTKMAGLTQQQRNQAMATIFGSDAMRAANVLFNDTKGFDKWSAGISKTGTAAENARTRMDNLKGDLSKLGSAIQNDLIGSAGGASDALRPLVQLATGGAQAFGSLPGPVKTAGFALAGLAAASLLGLAGYAKVKNTVVEGVAAWKSSSTAITGWMTTARAAGGVSGALATSLKGLGLAVGVAGAAWAANEATDWAASIGKVTPETDDLAASLKNLSGQNAGGALADMFRENGSSISIFGHQIGAGREQVVSFSDVTDRLKDSLDALQEPDWQHGILDSGAFSNAQEQIGQVDQALAKLVSDGNLQAAKDAFTQLTKGMSPDQVKQLTVAMPTYAAAVKAAGDQSKSTGDKTADMGDQYEGASPGVRSLGSALQQTGDSADDAAKKAKSLSQAIKDLGQEYLDPLDAQAKFYDAVEQSGDALKDGAHGLDLTTEAGRKSLDALNSLASANRDWASSVYDSTGSMDAAQAALDTGRGKFLSLAQSLGVPAAKAKDLADQLFDLSSIRPEVDTTGLNGAKVSLDNLGNTIVQVDGRKVTIPVGTVNVPQVIQLIANVKGAALSADGTKVTIPTSSPTAPLTKLLLNNITGAATTADGKSVVIPTEAADQVTTYGALLKISGAAVSADAKSVTIPTGAPLADATKQKLQQLEGVTVSADGKSVSVDTSAPGLSSVIGQVRTLLSQPSTKYITVQTRFTQVGQAPGLGLHGIVNAQGGVYGPGAVKRFGQGGVNRPAMIARGGSNILWAEDETHGESYIPHAMDRRPRAIQILGKTADIFGYQITPAADGRFNSRAWSAPSSSRVSVTSTATLSDDDRALLLAVAQATSLPVDVTIMTPDRKVLAREVAAGTRKAYA